MRTDTWYERSAWIFFALLSGMVLPLAILILIDPASAAGMWARFGYEMPAAVVTDPGATEYVEFISHWAATGTIGVNLLGLLIAVTAFRRGERWAWLAFWYWPVLFLTHFLTYTSSFRYAQLVWVTLSVTALLATRPKVWGTRAVEPDAVVAT